MYNSNVYNVMIVSPSDVVREREIIKDTIYDWNIIHSKHTGIILQPSGWDINSYPEMGSHPQKIINRQLLEKADVLIGVFWTRIGTATEEYDSGTIEEISEHVKLNKPTMIYFSKVPIIKDSVDMEQYQRLKNYQKSINKAGYYIEYNSIEEFIKLLSKQLQLMVIDKLQGATNSESEVRSTQHNENELNLVSQLNDISKFILKETSQDNRGIFMKIYVMGGVHFQTNGKAWLYDRSNPRELAEFEEAIEILENNGLITTNASKRDVFRLTADGYRIAESIIKNGA